MPIVMAILASALLALTGLFLTRIDVHVSKSTARGLASTEEGPTDKLLRLISGPVHRTLKKPYSHFTVTADRENQENTIQVRFRIESHIQADVVYWRLAGESHLARGTTQGSFTNVEPGSLHEASLNFSAESTTPLFLEVYTLRFGEKQGMTIALPILDPKLRPVPSDSGFKAFGKTSGPRLHL